METPRSSGRYYTNLRESDQIQKATTAMEALETQPEIIAAMTLRKYEPDGRKMAEGRARLQAVRDEVDDQTEDVGDKLSATRGRTTSCPARGRSTRRSRRRRGRCSRRSPTY